MPFFKIGEDTVKYSSNYKYLGITLTENGSNELAITTLANQTNKALFALMRGASKLSFPKPSLLCHLFDILVKQRLQSMAAKSGDMHMLKNWRSYIENSASLH